MKLINNLRLVLLSKLTLMGLKNKAICSKKKASVFPLTSVGDLTLFRESSLIKIHFVISSGRMNADISVNIFLGCI